MTTAGLDFLDVFSDRQCCRSRGQDVNVIIGASDSVQVTVQVLMDSPDVFVKALAMAVGQGSLAVFR